MNSLKAFQDILDKKENFTQKLTKEEKPSPFIQTSFVEESHRIYEQVNGFKFIDDEGNFHTLIKTEAAIYEPRTGEELEREVVLLPDKLQDYGTVEKLISEIARFISKYYDCDRQTLTFSSWYVLLTWVYDRLNTINYLRALGDLGTGKSRFLDTVGRICYKPIIGSGAGSVAALKRMVDKWRGTVSTDEGDFRNDDEKNDLVKFYNLGFEKNRAIYQCNKNDPNKIEFFNPYCPKIITTRQPFRDQALESRCITHVASVTSKSTKEIPIQLPSRFFKEQKILRNKLLKFRFDNYFKIDTDQLLELDLGDIEPRLKQACISFGSLFANFPQVFGEFKEFLADYQKEILESRESSFDGQIISTVCDLLLDGKKDITVSDVVEIGNFEKSNPRSIGKRLKSLGISTKLRKIDGKPSRYICLDEGLQKAVKRYVSDLEKVTSVTSVTSVTLTDTQTPNQAQKHNFQNSAVNVTHVTHVTDVTRKTSDLIKNFLEKEGKEKSLNAVFLHLNSLDSAIDNQDDIHDLLVYLRTQGLIFESKPDYWRLL